MSRVWGELDGRGGTSRLGTVLLSPLPHTGMAPAAHGFVLLPKRRLVERSDSRTMRARRNERGYERLMGHTEARIQWAFITLVSRRLARPRRQTEASTLPVLAA